jgi:hypothetical protein
MVELAIAHSSLAPAGRRIEVIVRKRRPTVAKVPEMGCCPIPGVLISLWQRA